MVFLVFFFPLTCTVLIVLTKKRVFETEHESYQIVLECFVIFKNVTHSLEPSETPSTVVHVVHRT